MLSKLHRFHGYGSLKGVYQRGQQLRGPGINLRYGARGGTGAYRMAVVVSRKVSKSAVVRNRIRRRIFEAVRTSPIKIPASSDLVFTVFADGVASLEAAKLQAAVNDLLSKAVAQPATKNNGQLPPNML